MSDIQDFKDEQESSLITEALPKALLTFIKVVFYFIVLPYKIWKASTLRLSRISHDALISDEEEFPVYTFVKVSYDAIIVVLPIFGFCIGIVLVLFGNIYFSQFITLLLACYFWIPIFSFIKEILTIKLSMVHSLEKIEKNTNKTSS